MTKNEKPAKHSRKKLIKKCLVTVIVIIAVVLSVLFAINLHGASTLKNDLIGEWYYADEYSCAILNISDSHIERTSDISDPASSSYEPDEPKEIYFINKNTFKVHTEFTSIDGEHKEFDEEYFVEFNSDKTEVWIQPSIAGGGMHEVWKKGTPSKTLLTEIVNNEIERQAEKEAEERARIKAQRTLDGLEIINFHSSVSNENIEKRVSYSVELKNNGTKPVKNVHIKVVVGDKDFEMILPEDDQVLMPGETVEAGDSHLIRRGVGVGDKGKVFLERYSSVN